MSLKRRIKKIQRICLISLVMLFFVLSACGGDVKVDTDEDCPTATDGQETVSGACPAPDIPLSWD